MLKSDKYFIENINEITQNGSWDENPRPKWKDGTPAHTKFITQVVEKYDIGRGEFPIPTLRNTAIKTGIREIIWIYQAQSNDLGTARDMGINWWQEWEVDGTDTIGQRYGATVARYDLINQLLKGLEENPFARRHIINMYQYSDLKETKGLDPCAYETLWSCRKIDGELYLDMTLIQRSNDYIMAGYINKIQYVALMMMIASHCGYKLGNFCHFVQNLHIYDRHLPVLNEMIENQRFDLNPFISLKSNKKFYEFTIEDFEVHNVEGIAKLSESLEIAV